LFIDKIAREALAVLWVIGEGGLIIKGRRSRHFGVRVKAGRQFYRESAKPCDEEGGVGAGVKHV